jgi:cytochrome P450
MTLSTGQTLPSGTRFCVPSWVVHNSTTTPSFSSQRKPLTEFDGLRFYDLRHIAGNENKHQFVATSSESLNFGHGNHACPGRFFASNEIKIVLIHLLMFWEIRLEGGEDGKGERPGNYINNFSVMPNPMAKVELKKRKLS